MALITCPECSGRVSSLASICPHCGFPISQYISNVLLSKLHTHESSVINVGDIIAFGTYRQRRTTLDKNEIQWIVLSHINNCYMLICKNCLEFMPFGDFPNQGTWKTSTVRRWLNNDFYTEAFTEEQRQLILNISQVNRYTKLYAGNDPIQAEDKVFLLSRKEVKNLREFLNIAQDSEHVETLRYKHTKVSNNCPNSNRINPPASQVGWWLRSHLEAGYPHYYLQEERHAAENTKTQCDVPSGIRPVIWIHIINR